MFQIFNIAIVLLFSILGATILSGVYMFPNGDKYGEHHTWLSHAK